MLEKAKDTTDDKDPHDTALDDDKDDDKDDEKDDDKDDAKDSLLEVSDSEVARRGPLADMAEEVRGAALHLLMSAREWTPESAA